MERFPRPTGPRQRSPKKELPQPDTFILKSNESKDDIPIGYEFGVGPVTLSVINYLPKKVSLYIWPEDPSGSTNIRISFFSSDSTIDYVVWLTIGTHGKSNRVATVSLEKEHYDDGGLDKYPPHYFTILGGGGGAMLTGNISVYINEALDESGYATVNDKVFIDIKSMKFLPNNRNLISTMINRFDDPHNPTYKLEYTDAETHEDVENEEETVEANLDRRNIL